MIRWRRHLGLLVGGAAVAVSVVAAGAAPLLTPYGWDEQHLEAAFHILDRALHEEDVGEVITLAWGGRTSGP